MQRLISEKDYSLLWKPKRNWCVAMGGLEKIIVGKKRG